MPAPLVVAVAVVLALSGAVMLAVAWASWAQKLPRNRFAGVRTPATMRSEEAFKLANKIAAPGIAAGGLVLALTAVGVLALPAAWGASVAVALGAVVSLVPVGYGAYIGNKAAGKLPSMAESAPTCPYSAEVCASGGGCGGAKVCGD